MRIGMLYSRVRVEEKLLLEEFTRRGITIERIDDRDLVLEIGQMAGEFPYDVVMERSINHSRALYALKLLNDAGVSTVNTYKVADTCGNKILTSSALARQGVPSPRTLVAFTPEEEIHKAITRRIAAIDFEALAQRAVQEGIDRARGRV